MQGELRVTVQDTGLGIAEDDANNLFKLFSQLDTTHTKNYGGSGLGLYISKQIVELMGGTISFKSVLGQGTEFFVTIPVDFSFKQADEIATIADQAPDEEALVPTYSFLVVDDNKTNLSVTKALLENLDQKVEVCTNGYSALHRLLTHSYDVVLLDIQMPILDGYGTFALFQTLGTTQRPTIAALTAFAGQADVEALKGAGFDDVLVKPISLLSAKRFLQKLAGFSEPLADRTSATTLLALLLDKEIIQTLVQLIGPDEYCKAMQEFMGELAVLLSGLSDGHENQYKANLHTIKGSAYTLGLQGIGHAAKHYELALAAHDTVPPDEARTVLEHLAMLSVKFASELIGSL